MCATFAQEVKMFVMNDNCAASRCCRRHAMFFAKPASTLRASLLAYACVAHSASVYHFPGARDMFCMLSTISSSSSSIPSPNESQVTRRRIIFFSSALRAFVGENTAFSLESRSNKLPSWKTTESPVARCKRFIAFTAFALSSRSSFAVAMTTVSASSTRVCAFSTSSSACAFNILAASLCSSAISIARSATRAAATCAEDRLTAQAAASAAR
mmetsp:Transcript_6775/g.27183  ORF Transcript_6775/g.27183 Transcript_6775/m.27183 type:complete len:213 (+) Transcript_6775:685-1323(+)